MKKTDSDIVELEKRKRLNEWKSGKNQAPIKLVLFPTDRCNLDCLFCWRHNEPMYKNEIETKYYNSIIDQCSSLGIKEVLISGGGEPLLYKDAIGLMEQIKRNNIRGVLITNGTLFKQKDIEKLVDIGWDIIEFSIEGLGEVNDSLRGKGSFEIVTNNLAVFNRYKKLKGKEKPILIFRTVVNNRNYDKLEDFILFAAKNNIKKIEFNQLNADKGSFAENLILDEGQKQSLIRKIAGYKKNAKNNKIEIAFNLDIFDNNPETSFYCVVPWTELLIRPNGDVSVCCHIKDKFGNIKDKPLEKIWYGEKLNSFRKKIQNNELHEKCKKCDIIFSENE